MPYIPRLNPTRLNELNSNLMKPLEDLGYIEDLGYTIKEGELKVTGVITKTTKYKNFLKDGLSYFVFETASNIKKTNGGEIENAAFINDVITQFSEANKNKAEISLLIPLMQTGSGLLWRILDFLGFSRVLKHSVLVEITINNMGNERKMNIRIHNSASGWGRKLFYSDHLKDLEIKDPKTKSCQVKIDYIDYAKQKDSDTCAYFVHLFIRKILENPNVSSEHILSTFDPHPEIEELKNKKLLSCEDHKTEGSEKYFESEEDGFIVVSQVSSSFSFEQTSVDLKKIDEEKETDLGQSATYRR